MLIDFYMRNEYEPGYNSNSLFVVDPYEILLNKIKMILFTRPGEVFGNPDFGIDLESYVFETRINEQQIVSNIYQLFNKYIPEISEFDIKINANFTKGDYGDELYLDFFVDDKKIYGLLVK